jgi:Rieske Fe-S protein
MTDSAPDQQSDPAFDRRRVLGVAAVAGMGVPLLAACGQNSDATSSTSASSSTSPTAGKTTKPASGGSDLVATSAVPLDGGVVIQDKKVVVTQPSKGTFKAFTAVCTHMGCIVSQVSNNTITCPCHGSQYSAEDGSVMGGPAPAPLSPVNIKVKGGEIVAS